MLKIKNWQFLNVVKRFATSKNCRTFALSKDKDNNIVQHSKHYDYGKED